MTSATTVTEVRAQPGATTAAPRATAHRVPLATESRIRVVIAAPGPQAIEPPAQPAIEVRTPAPASIEIAAPDLCARYGAHVVRRPRPEGGPRPEAGLTAQELAEVVAARGTPHAERLESANVTPEAMATAKEILEQIMSQLEFNVRVEIKAGETNRLNVVGEGDEKEALGALIGRKGERLSALQHLVNLLLSKRVGEWTRILVDVEDYRGRREGQLRDLANRAAERVVETGKMLQLEPMPALERRWIHLALRDHERVATQSIGEEPNRRVVVVPRNT